MNSSPGECSDHSSGSSTPCQVNAYLVRAFTSWLHPPARKHTSSWVDHLITNWNSAGWVKHEPQKAKPQQIRALLNPFQAPEPFRPTRPWRGYPQKGVGWKQTPWPNKETRAACVPHGGAKLRSVEASGARKYRHCLSDTDSLIDLSWAEDSMQPLLFTLSALYQSLLDAVAG